MAELTIGRDRMVTNYSARAVEWVLEHKALVALGVLMIIAAALRFIDLDTKALHHDESLHSHYTWNLYRGLGYKHDPLMHGPFLFHSGAAVFFLFGATDFTTRILPALFGTVLVGMPYLLHKQIGMKAVLIAAVLITVSPSLLFVSRFYRDDIYIDVWMFALVICAWRYLDEQKPFYLYIFAAVLALSFATMEITFMLAAIMLLFLNLMLAVELGKRREDEEISRARVLLRTAAIFPVAWLLAALWPFLDKRQFGRTELPPVAHVLLILGTFSLPQFAAGVQYVPISVGDNLAALSDGIPLVGGDLASFWHKMFAGDLGYRTPAEDTMRNVTVFTLLAVSAIAGLLWRWDRWLIAAAAFYVPYVLLFTTFFTNKAGWFSGTWGSLDYWLAQHDVQRGDQPDYYYALMTPLYEFLPMLLALGAVAWILLRGDWLKRWFLFWLVGIFVGLSVAGEKMPWLEVHIVLPLTLVAAVGLAALLEKLDFRDNRWGVAAVVGAAACLATLLVVDGEGMRRLIGWLIFAGLGGWIAASLATLQPKAVGRAVLAIGVAVFFTLTVRAGVNLSFDNPDTPIEMAVYTQTSPEIPAIQRRIDEIAKQSGLGYNLPIVVDQTSGFTWPWAWYLRNYKQLLYINNVQNYDPPANAVLLIHSRNANLLDPTDYTQTPFIHRWWFNESYKNLTLSKVKDIATDWDALQRLGHFFLYRRAAETNTGSENGVAFFPESLSVYDPALTKAPLEPTRLADGRIIIGQAGSARGELLQPADVFVDKDRNVWVADSRNNRIQQFDRDGNFVASLGANGTKPAQFTEPWSVAVDNEGFIYVADTWAHRIQKFSPELDFVTSWGTPSASQNPGLLELFGPRDIVIAADGTLWVTDTGNKRLIHYAADGTPLGSLGSGGIELGKFSEPVGLQIDSQGRFYVADAWNGRVQVLSPDFSSGRTIRTTWTSHEVLDKPYLAVLTDGRMVVAEPAQGLLLLYNAEGNPAGVWKPEGNAEPLGLTALPDGGFVFSDGGGDQVQIIPGSAINGLFR